MTIEEDERRYRALGDAILSLRGLSAMNQSPRSINASIIAEAERVLIDAGIDDVPLPKRRGIIRPARLLEKLDGGAAIRVMHQRRAVLEERSGCDDPLPAPRTFDAEWWVGPVGKTLMVVFAAACVSSAIAFFVRLVQNS